MPTLDTKTECEEYVASFMASYDKRDVYTDKSRDEIENGARLRAEWQYVRQIIKGFLYTVLKHHDELFEEYKKMFKELYQANLHIDVIRYAQLGVRDDYVEREKYFFDPWIGNIALYDGEYAAKLIEAIRQVLIEAGDEHLEEFSKILNKYLKDFA